MTPVATPVDRRRTERSAASRKQAPGALRRISGPLSARAAAAATAASARLVDPAPTSPRETGPRETAPWRAPRRRSGPLRSGAAGSPSGRLATFLQALPDHALLDRIVRGRAWIPILGVMLAGIVAMQVEMLKLGTTIGRTLQQSAALQTRNQLLRIDVASLADDQRIERLAETMGMVMPEPTTIGFLSARSAKPRDLATSIHAPDPSAFLSSLASLEAAGGSVLGATSPLGGSAAAGVGLSQAAAATQAAGTSAGQPSPGSQTQAAPATQAAASTEGQAAPAAAASPSGQAAPPAQAATPAPAQTAAPAAGEPGAGTAANTSGGAAAPSGG